jgi:hypothetical protein
MEVSRRKRFHIWTGNGSNGKVRPLIFEQSFGDCCKLPITLLTQSVQHPMLPLLNNKNKRERFAYVQG